MKRIIIESIFILILAFFLSVMFTAASPSGMPLLKKAFNIKIADTAEKTGDGEKSGSGAISK